MAALSFNYNQTIAQAKELEEMAQEMQSKSCKQLDEICQSIEASWTGDSAKLYRTYLTSVADRLKKQAKFLQDIAEFLRSAAAKMQQAEQAAKSAAGKL